MINAKWSSIIPNTATAVINSNIYMRRLQGKGRNKWSFIGLTMIKIRFLKAWEIITLRLFLCYIGMGCLFISKMGSLLRRFFRISWMLPNLWVLLMRVLFKKVFRRGRIMRVFWEICFKGEIVFMIIDVAMNKICYH